MNLWSYIANAGGVVKIVMLLLMLASIVSWAFIFQRWQYFSQARKNLIDFEKRFWSGIDLMHFYQVLEQKQNNISGLSKIFHAGFREYEKLSRRNLPENELMAATQRAMRVAQTREQENMEKHLSFLATVGSTSPYVGLFGTVWGIMTAFQALGSVSAATISMVAPGISEALIATAMGLFAAIPAVIAYNRFNDEAERLMQNYQRFGEEFASVLQHQPR